MRGLGLKHSCFAMPIQQQTEVGRIRLTVRVDRAIADFGEVY